MPLRKKKNIYNQDEDKRICTVYILATILRTCITYYVLLRRRVCYMNLYMNK